MKTSVSVSPPIVPKDLENVGLVRIEAGQRIELAKIEKLAVSNIEAKAITIDSVIFENAEISSCTLKKASLSDVIFNNCLLFGSNFDESGFLRIHFSRGTYSGLVLSATLLKDVAFDSAKLNLANFRTAKFNQVILQDCDLKEADFQGAQMKHVKFKNCDLSGAEFAGCKMSDVDFRGSNISTIKGVAGLRGATIDTIQLISLTHRLAADVGLIISED